MQKRVGGCKKTERRQSIKKVEKTENVARNEKNAGDKGGGSASCKKFNKLLSEVGVGALGGFINGFFGGGGGMVIVPMLIYLLKYERKNAHASCIAVVLPMAAAGGLVYALGGKIDYIKLLPVVIGVLVGGTAGALLLKKINSKLLNYLFCAVMVLAGLKMLF